MGQRECFNQRLRSDIQNNGAPCFVSMQIARNLSFRIKLKCDALYCVGQRDRWGVPIVAAHTRRISRRTRTALDWAG
jgi:hypothetical protein